MVKKGKSPKRCRTVGGGLTIDLGDRRFWKFRTEWGAHRYFRCLKAIKGDDTVSSPPASGASPSSQVKVMHIMCKNKDKINEAYKKLNDGWLRHHYKVPPAEFAKLVEEYSESPSREAGGALGWIPLGKMAGQFQSVVFDTSIGGTSKPFQWRDGHHIVLCEGRRT